MRMSDSVVLKVNGRCRWSTVILIAAVFAALIAQTAHALEPCSDPDTCLGLLATELVFSDSACPGDSEDQCITVINTVNAYRAFDEQYDLYTVTQYISDDLVDALGMDKLVVKVSQAYQPRIHQRYCCRTGQCIPGDQHMQRLLHAGEHDLHLRCHRSRIRGHTQNWFSNIIKPLTGEMVGSKCGREENVNPIIQINSPRRFLWIGC
jgi:hypothetical protein